MRLASGQKVTEMKRLFDVVTAALALLLLALPLLALAWLIRRKLGSPVLFRQVRPGLAVGADRSGGIFKGLASRANG
jgi:lipopolysaccharide/colanic/teichoic acid biosynthesis glycosyltransferase